MAATKPTSKGALNIQRFGGTEQSDCSLQFYLDYVSYKPLNNIPKFCERRLDFACSGHKRAPFWAPMNLLKELYHHRLGTRSANLKSSLTFSTSRAFLKLSRSMSVSLPAMASKRDWAQRSHFASAPGALLGKWETAAKYS